jgi:cytochrome c-type biogenesis protein CcmE
MTLVLGIVAGVAIAGTLALNAFRSNVTFFFDPTQVSQGEVKSGERFRLGGMVTQGSVKRMPGSLEVRFVVTDFKHDVPVSYTGVLPDLFREGTGVVAHGRMSPNGTFVADEVLAKHDEKYMPPEVAKSLKRRHGEAREDAVGEPTAPSAGAGAGSGQSGAGSSPQSPSTTRTQGPQGSGRPAIEAAPTSREGTTALANAGTPAHEARTASADGAALRREARTALADATALWRDAPTALANGTAPDEALAAPRTALSRTGTPPPPGGL